MPKSEYFSTLKKRYFSPKYKREELIDKFWILLDIPSSRALGKYRYRLDKLAVKADFCLALHKLLIQKLGTECFEKLFAKELRTDYDDLQSIKHHFKKIEGRGNLKRNFPEDPNVSYTRLIFNLDYVNSRTKSPKILGKPESKNDQIMRLIQNELKECLSKSDPPIYPTWISHFVHNQPLRSIAAEQGVSHEAIRLRLAKAQKIVTRRLFVNKWYLTEEL